MPSASSRLWSVKAAYIAPTRASVAGASLALAAVSSSACSWESTRSSSSDASDTEFWPAGMVVRFSHVPFTCW